MKCWNCGGTEFKAIYDWVPYGSTDVQMYSGDVCVNCNEEYMDPKEMEDN